jgi:hypothetical protein
MDLSTKIFKLTIKIENISLNKLLLIDAIVMDQVVDDWLNAIDYTNLH